MTDSSYMGQTLIANTTTGFCRIKEPDTGNPNAKNPRFRKTPPKWTAEIIIDRERDEELLNSLREHAAANGYEGDKGEEPWIKTKPEYVKDDKTFPAYEYIDVMTKNNPHEWSLPPGTRIVDGKQQPFTDEIFKGAEVNVVCNPQYTEIHDYRMTFYLELIQVMKNGTSGGGNPMTLLATPTFGDSADNPMGKLNTQPSFN